jgi:hypothetical protein
VAPNGPDEDTHDGAEAPNVDDVGAAKEVELPNVIPDTGAALEVPNGVLVEGPKVEVPKFEVGLDKLEGKPEVALLLPNVEDVGKVEAGAALKPDDPKGCDVPKPGAPKLLEGALENPDSPNPVEDVPNPEVGGGAPTAGVPNAVLDAAAPNAVVAGVKV